MGEREENEIGRGRETRRDRRKRAGGRSEREGETGRERKQGSKNSSYVLTTQDLIRNSFLKVRKNFLE